jgi:hypothetical protein
MIIEEKMRILAKFFVPEFRDKDDPHLDKIFSLEDTWNDVYQDNVGRLSTKAAKVLANECVIAEILSDTYL